MSHTATASAPRSAFGRLADGIDRVVGLLGRFPGSITQLVLRIALAVPFWRSGLTKWEGFGQLSDSAVLLFSEEFKLHVFGQTISYPAPAVVAYASGVVEIVLPLLLVFGLATRFAATGLLVMTAMIQLTVPNGWASFHLPWAAMALAVMTYGAGRLSLDDAIARVFRRSGAMM